MADFCFIGDLHLDALTKYWPNANRIKLDSARRIIKRESLRGCKHFILLGDISQGIRDSTGNKIRLSEDAQVELLQFLVEFDKKVTIDIILGNHDVAEQGSHSLQIFIAAQAAGMFNTINFFDKPSVIKRSGARISLLPFPEKIPHENTHFAVAHYEVHGAVGDTGYKIKHETPDFDTPVVQGHLHTRQKVRNHYYPGTLYQLSFGEKLPKGYGMGRVEDGRFLFKWVKHTPPFELRNVRVEQPADFDKLENNPLLMQKLFVSSDVNIPPNLLKEYPNIVNALSYSNEKELESLYKAELELEQASVSFSHTEFLPSVLQALGASKKQVARALSILEELK